MNSDKAKKIEQQIEAFGHGLLQDLVNLGKVLDNAGITIGEVEKYLERQKTQSRKESDRRVKRVKKIRDARSKEWKKKGPKCPECGSVLNLRQLKAAGNQNLHGYKSHFYCVNGDCVYEKYSLKPVEEIVKELGVRS